VRCACGYARRVSEHRSGRSAPHLHLSHGAFGNDRFGILAERFARFFGTPKFIIGQTILVILWIAANAAAYSFRWDPYPFILLNLAFSTQAAYAAPLILLAQTRQADRDKVAAVAFEAHRDDVDQRQLTYEARLAQFNERERTMSDEHARMLAQNTALTEQIAALTRDLHAKLCSDASS
jgi:uncharacterized membrane protein